METRPRRFLDGASHNLKEGTFVAWRPVDVFATVKTDRTNENREECGSIAHSFQEPALVAATRPPLVVPQPDESLAGPTFHQAPRLWVNTHAWSG